jgi:phage terminase large subunit
MKINFTGTYSDYLGKFSKYVGNRSRYMLWKGGAGSGKSHGAAQLNLFRILDEPVNHRILLVRKVHRTIRQSQFQLISDKISGWGMSSLFDINKTDMTFTYRPNGNQFLSAGLDDVEKIKSIERITSIWIEEATEVEEKEFDQLDMRLRGELGTYKQILLTFNPIDANHWIKRRFFDSNLEDCVIDESTAWQNPWIDRQYLRVLDNLKNQDRVLYEIYALGKWGILEGLIYHNWQTCKEWPESFDETIYGLDFGFNNPTALLEINYKDNNIYERELLYKDGLTNADLIAILPSLIPNKKRYIFADCAEPARIEEMRRAGWNVWESDKSVKDGIDACKRVQIFVHPESQNDVKELGGYKWKEDKNGNAIDEPVKWMDHLQDARRYAHYTYIKKFSGNWSGISIKSKR